MLYVVGSTPQLPPLGCFLIIAIGMFLVGLWGAIDPRNAAMAGERWKYQGNVEPSDLNLCLIRVMSISFILGAIGITLFAILTHP
jgi:hypothetical protein